MFLKRYTSIELPERLLMRRINYLLPDMLRLQSCFFAAIRCLDELAVSHPCPRPQSKEEEQAIRNQAAPFLKPQVGIMIQRASYYKARSIQHCCEMDRRRRISVERKYDGEYCQVHIDLADGKQLVKLFSKSGKDSTGDRVRLHGPIMEALKLGQKACPIKK
jgi:DNA ligase 4